MKKRLINILFYLFIIILLFISVYINKDYSIIINKKIINNEQTLNKYKDYKFVTLNLKNVKESRFSISDNKSKSIVYTVLYNNKTVLVELNNSTVITDKIDVMYMDDKANINMVKNNISEESDVDIDFIKGYYTNINYGKNKEIISIKFYITIFLGSISLLFMLLNFIGMFIYKKDYE
ncbi:MAG: hypothetical protein J6O56_02630 [Bacilli bacterium]|nr:hypothetical protein [Bacilli bacterium]